MARRRIEAGHGGVEGSGGGVGAQAEAGSAGGVGGEHASLGGIDDPSGVDAACERLLRAGSGQGQR